MLVNTLLQSRLLQRSARRLAPSFSKSTQNPFKVCTSASTTTVPAFTLSTPLFHTKKYNFSFSTASYQVLENGNLKGDGFFSQQIQTPCLAEFAYYIESKGEAAIIDPLRESSPYIQLAKQRGAKIKYILETHFHADFVSGHLPLAASTGATIVFGPNAVPNYPAHVAKDGESLSLGDIQIKVIHTPGHTMQSSCFLLQDKNNKPVAVYTGDTLFLGEVGRPDLAVKTNEITVADLAGYLYDSLKKVVSLPGEVIVYPGHGAGSACGKNIGTGKFCNISTQLKNNYALQQMSKADFIKIVSADLPKPPQYFFYDAGLNKNGYQLSHISDVKQISPSQVKKLLKEKQAVILDSRVDISEGFIEGSLNISLASPFSNWVGSLIKPQTNLIIFSDVGMEEETIMRLRRIGYDHIVGFFKATQDEITQAGLQIVTPQIVSPQDFIQQVNNDKNKILLDVRTINEFNKGHMRNAQILPLAELSDTLENNPLPKDQTLYAYCGTGVRVQMAYGIFRQFGYEQLKICQVGFNDIKAAGGDVSS